MLLLRKLVCDLCPPSPSAAAHVAPDLRIGPTLPPPSSVASARDFSDLDDIARAFDGFRVEHRSNLHSSSAPVSTATATSTLKSAKQKHERVASHVAACHHHLKSMPPDDQLQQQQQQWSSGMSFARCLLSLADPTAQLLSPPDFERCLAAFIEKATASVAREAESIAKAFADQSGCTRASVVESLADPLACLSDDGLNDAAVTHMARTLRVALVVRRGSPGTPCVVFPAKSEPSDPAALIAWNDREDRFELLDGVAGGRLSDVQAALIREDGGSLGARLRALAPFERHKVAVLQEAASQAAVVLALPGKQRATKAAWSDALTAALLLGHAPDRTV